MKSFPVSRVSVLPHHTKLSLCTLNIGFSFVIARRHIANGPFFENTGSCRHLGLPYGVSLCASSSPRKSKATAHAFAHAVANSVGYELSGAGPDARSALHSA